MYFPGLYEADGITSSPIEKPLINIYIYLTLFLTPHLFGTTDSGDSQLRFESAAEGQPKKLQSPHIVLK